jgi:hypothetical protein
MTPKEKAREIARLLNAWADGKQLEVFRNGIWQEPKENPYISRSNLHTWRVKLESRSIWLAMSEGLGPEIAHVVDTEEKAEKWRRRGHVVTKWQEVTE